MSIPPPPTLDGGPVTPNNNQGAITFNQAQVQNLINDAVAKALAQAALTTVNNTPAPAPAPAAGAPANNLQAQVQQLANQVNAELLRDSNGQPMKVDKNVYLAILDKAGGPEARKEAARVRGQTNYSDGFFDKIVEGSKGSVTWRTAIYVTVGAVVLAFFLRMLAQKMGWNIPILNPMQDQPKLRAVSGGR